MCGEQYPTLAFALPFYHLLINKLKEFQDTPGRFEEGNFIILILKLIKPLYYYTFYSKQQIMLLTNFQNIIIKQMHQEYILLLQVNYYINLIIFKNLNVKFNILIIFIVLDPRLKLQYLKDNKWERRLIDNAKKKVFNLIKNTVFILLILFKIYILTGS